MKKYILPVILLALLTGCGKVTDSSGDESRISIVSGTIEGSASPMTTSTRETVTENTTTTDQTTTDKKVAGDKIEDTTTTRKAPTQPTTRSVSGGTSSGRGAGTTRYVPPMPRTTTTTAETTQTTTVDYRDQSGLTYAVKEGEISEMRDGKNIQRLENVDTDEVLPLLESSSVSQDEVIVQGDFDFDGINDLFVAEKIGAMNTTGKYYRYDTEKGIYIAWSDLNKRQFKASLNSNDNTLTFYDKSEDKIEYESWTCKWNDKKELITIEYERAYKDAGDPDKVYYQTIKYDEETGAELSNITRDSEGNEVGVDPPEEQPQTE